METNLTIQIGKNKMDNDKLFESALGHHTWFHIANERSAHLWINVSTSSISKNQLYQIALKLKKKSKFSKTNFVEIVYAQKDQLQKTEIVGQIQITGKSKKIRV